MFDFLLGKEAHGRRVWEREGLGVGRKRGEASGVETRKNKASAGEKEAGCWPTQSFLLFLDFLPWPFSREPELRCKVRLRYLLSFPAVQCTSNGAGGVSGEARCSRMVRNGAHGLAGSAAAARMALYAFTNPCSLSVRLGFKL